MDTLEAKTSERIEAFEGVFHFLSNFHRAYLIYEDIMWPTSEHAYQAMKTFDHNQRLNISTIGSPAEAKSYARSLKRRADWDDVKLGIMEEIVRAKFTQNDLEREKLLATEDLEIVEGNTWGDTFWGVCNGVGENHLGKILMKIREELRE